MNDSAPNQVAAALQDALAPFVTQLKRMGDTLHDVVDVLRDQGGAPRKVQKAPAIHSRPGTKRARAGAVTHALGKEQSQQLAVSARAMAKNGDLALDLSETAHSERNDRVCCVVKISSLSPLCSPLLTPWCYVCVCVCVCVSASPAHSVHRIGCV